LSNWRILLDRALRGLAELKRQGQPAPEWTLGGGTALMLHANHRLSRDIDAFIDDPQHLASLSPDVTDVWNCNAWDKAAHYLKLEYPEGEIDFIVTHSISGLPPIAREIDLTGLRSGFKPIIRVEPVAEIALKKMHYRATMLKPRDIFDIAVVDKLDRDALVGNLGRVADSKDGLLRRLNGLKEDFLKAELEELDIQPGWENEKANCLTIVRSIVERIPRP
jgi:hypothetical protein